VTVGLRYVWGHEVLRPLALTVAAFAFLNEANMAIFVLLVTDHIGLGEVGFGLLISVDAIVAVIASFFVAMVVRRIGHSGSMRTSVVLYGAGMLLLGLGTSAATAVAAAVVMGLSDPLWNVISSTIRQRLVPDQIFGRMMTAYLFIAWGAQPLGAIAGGVVAWAWGPEWVYLISVPAMVLLYIGARPMFEAVDRAMGPPV
jgi:MFS family permease